MPEVTRIAMLILMAGHLVVFVIVPMFVLALGVEDIIYYRGELTAGLLTLNALLTLPALIAIRLNRGSSHAVEIHKPEEAKWLRLTPYLLFAWAFIFLTFGGTTYRHIDVAIGYDARSKPLQVSLALTNIIMIVGAALWSASKEIPITARVVPLALIGACFVLGGSRGLAVQFALTVWLTIKIESLNDRASDQLLAPVRIITPQAIGGAVLLAAIVGTWGALRDQQDDTLFGTLYRASEPYWHHAYIRFQEHGPDPQTIYDSALRILSIPGRWIGVTYDYSIDGSEKILEEKLDIPYVEGISLPITYIGEGLLFFGHTGAFVFQSIIVLLIIHSLKIINRLPFIGRRTKSAIIAFQINKCAFLYGKSLSGAVLVMYYETFRDYILIITILLTLKVINEKFNH